MSHEPMTADEVKAAFEKLPYWDSLGEIPDARLPSGTRIAPQSVEQAYADGAAADLRREWEAGRIGSFDAPRKRTLEWVESQDGPRESACRPEARTAIEGVFEQIGHQFDMTIAMDLLAQLELTDSEWSAAIFSLGQFAEASGK